MAIVDRSASRRFSISSAGGFSCTRRDGRLRLFFRFKKKRNCSFPADFLGVIFLINVEYQMEREEDNVHGQYVEMGGGTL